MMISTRDRKCFSSDYQVEILKEKLYHHKKQKKLYSKYLFLFIYLKDLKSDYPFSVIPLTLLFREYSSQQSSHPIARC